MSEEFLIDWDRMRRTGVTEAILCEPKTPAQIDAIVASASGRRLLLTRLDEVRHAALAEATRSVLAYDLLSGTAVLGGSAPLTRTGVGIVAAGTSDLRVAREAAQTLAFHGHPAEIVADVGVAGLWRLTERLEALRAFPLLIAVAGMEGALFSVLAGLVEAPVIAVPSSVGYGVSAGGKVALEAALASCAPGLVVVNVDNGFGAALAAIKMLRLGSSADVRLDQAEASHR